MEPAPATHHRRERVARRRFLDLPHGQVHYWDLPATPDPASPVVSPLLMLHASPLSGRSLVPLARELTPKRRAIVLDLPGNGDSEPLGLSEPGVDDFALVLGQVVDALTPDGADVYGMHTGASMAVALALLAPRGVRRLVLEGLASFDPDLRDRMLVHQAPVVAPDPGGLHVLWAWQYVRDSCLFFPWFERDAAHRRPLGLPGADALHERFVDVVKAFGTYRHSYRASIAYNGVEHLQQLTGTPVLMLATASDMLRSLTEAAAVSVGADFMEVADAGPVAGGPNGRATTIEQWLQDGDARP